MHILSEVFMEKSATEARTFKALARQLVVAVIAVIVVVAVAVVVVVLLTHVLKMEHFPQVEGHNCNYKCT